VNWTSGGLGGAGLQERAKSTYLPAQVTEFATMPGHYKRYWVIEITRRSDTVFRKRLAGNLSTKKITTILQRLASCDLTPSEVIAASVRNPDQISRLKPRVDTPSNGRTVICLPALRDYKAGYCRGYDALANLPEIPPERQPLSEPRAGERRATLAGRG
jgi:hypothetical protein